MSGLPAARVTTQDSAGWERRVLLCGVLDTRERALGMLSSVVERAWMENGLGKAAARKQTQGVSKIGY